MTHLLSMDHQRRDSKAVGFQTAGTTMSPSQSGTVDGEPSSPLQQASKVLNDMNAEFQFNMISVDSMNDPQKATVIFTPTMDPNARNGSLRSANAAPQNPKSALVDPKMAGDPEQVLYPVGAINGIDLMYSEHINNVSYPMPPKQEVDPSDARRKYPDNRKKSNNVNPGWVRSPHILLVEDDATCRQIGEKFLYSFSCVIDTAVCLMCH